jgi:hypothetical protein
MEALNITHDRYIAPHTESMMAEDYNKLWTIYESAEKALTD